MASGINRLKYNRAAKRNKLGHKISKIMHEGIRGKKVSRKQAIAVAFSMLRRHK